MTTFPAALRNARREFAGLSQVALAGAIGVSSNSVFRWESGTSVPRPATINRIATKLRCDPGELLRAAGYEEAPIDAPFTDAIRAARTTRGLYQRQVAELVGVRKSAVKQWETGNGFPRSEYWPAIERVLGIDAAAMERYRDARQGRQDAQGRLKCETCAWLTECKEMVHSDRPRILCEVEAC